MEYVENDIEDFKSLELNDKVQRLSPKGRIELQEVVEKIIDEDGAVIFVLKGGAL